MAVCYIAGAGECKEISIIKETDDIVIAADAVIKHLEKANITPDCIIGDFDSLGAKPEGKNVIALKPEKDVTDMHAAVEIGIEKGFSRFVIYGATGGRLDHTLANIQLLASLAERGIKAVIKDGETEIIALCNSSVSFPEKNKGYISVFAHSDVCKGVTIKGLKYELKNAELKNTFALGVSNEFIGKESVVSVEKGILILHYCV